MNAAPCTQAVGFCKSGHTIHFEGVVCQTVRRQLQCGKEEEVKCQLSLLNSMPCLLVKQGVLADNNSCQEVCSVGELFTFY